MKLISRYLITRLATASFYTLLAVLALYSFIDFVSEAGIIGRQNYTLSVAIQYVLMRIPAHAYELMPLTTLIGGLIALNQLSSNSEWAVIKTCGLSRYKLISIIVRFGLIFAVVTLMLGEWLAPDMSRRASEMKATARTGQISAIRNGIWIKQPESMIHIDSMLPDKTLKGIKIWRYGQDFTLKEAIAAERATANQQQWALYNVQSSILHQDRVETTQDTHRIWQTDINSNLLDILLIRPEQMPFSALTRYISYLKANKQQTTLYDIAWWNKLVYPIATIVMALMALAFTPVSGRHNNMGLKLLGGICLGFLFFFTGRLFGFTTQLYGVPAPISALLPTFSFALWAAYLINKQEKR